VEVVRVGVVGVGRWGRHHARVYSELEGCKLVGLVDLSWKRANELAEKYDTTPYTDFSTLFGKVDAVSVVTPPSSHYIIARAFLVEGINVLVDKPMTRTMAEADELVKLAKGNGLVLQVGHIERFNSAVQKLKDIVDSPIFIESHRLGPQAPQVMMEIGVVLDLMIHDIDIVLDLVNSEVRKVNSAGSSVETPYEDIATAQVSFANGCIANFTASRLSIEKKRSLEITQKDSYISLDFRDQDIEISRYADDPSAKDDLLSRKVVSERPYLSRKEPLKLELADFIDCVTYNKKPLVSGEEGRRALKVALQVLEGIGLQN